MYGTTLTVWLILAVVSMLVAVVIKGLVALLGRQNARAAAGAVAASPSPRPVAAPAAGSAGPGTAGAASPSTAGGHVPEHVAAISAAVAAVFDDSAVVVHIEHARSGRGWTSEGRAVHHTSHNVGRSPRQL